MFEQLKEIARSSVDVVESQGVMAEERVRRLVLLAIGALAAGFAGAAAFCGVLVGVVLVIAPRLGMGWSLLLVFGIVLLAVVTGVAIMYASAAKKRRKAARAARRAKQRFHEALHTERPALGADPIANGFAVRGAGRPNAVLALVSNPAVLAGAGVAAMSVLGFRRTIQLVRAASALTAARALVMKVAQSAGNRQRPIRSRRPRVEHAEEAYNDARGID